MAEPWYDPQAAAVWGNYIGAFAGALFGIVGGTGGSLAYRGKGRRWVIPFLAISGTIGVLLLIYGLIALIAGQPRGIWYSPVLGGALLGGLGWLFVWDVGRRYEAAERRKLEAEAIRAG